MNAQRDMKGSVTIAGAGPAGLACAIILARGRRRVVAREWHLPLLRVGIVNRFIFNLVGEPGWRIAVKRLSRGDSRLVLRRFYRPSALSRFLFPLALFRYRAPLRDRSCDHAGCHCIWCQCQAEIKAAALT